MKNAPLLDDGTMPVDMTIPEPDQIKITMMIRDELDFPLERRSYQTQIPRTPEDRAIIATAIGKTAERTARFMLGLPAEDEFPVVKS